MSSAVRPDLSPKGDEQDRLFFWIRPTDEAGLKVDEVFAAAAYSKARDLRFYRWKELSDDAVRADLVEQAVFTASRSQEGASAQDPKAYVFTIFARLVDRYISKDKLLLHERESDLERLQQVHGQRNSADAKTVENDILQDQILAAMPPDDQWCWRRRLLGYELQEIAADLNVSPDCLSTRLRRGAKDAVRRLRLGRARQ